MSMRIVTVFGGTGFLGRRVVRHLREQDFSVRIASRHPDRSRRLFGSGDPQLRAVGTDIQDERTVADALADAYGAVNAVSLTTHGAESRVGHFPGPKSRTRSKELMCQIYGERHLRRILTLYSLYYNETRTHLGLGKDAPLRRSVQRSGTIIVTPILSGLHHRYARI